MLQSWAILVQVRHDAAAAAEENNNSKNKNMMIVVIMTTMRLTIVVVIVGIIIHHHYIKCRRESRFIIGFINVSPTRISQKAVLLNFQSERDRWHYLCLAQDKRTENLPPQWCHSVELHEVSLLLQHPIRFPHPRPHSSFLQWRIPLTPTIIAHVLRRGDDILCNWKALPDVVVLLTKSSPHSLSSPKNKPPFACVSHRPPSR